MAIGIGFKLILKQSIVMPAQAGICVWPRCLVETGIAAFAGMTE